MGARGGAGGAGALVRGVVGAQEARARTYARFREGFRAYLAGGAGAGAGVGAAEREFQAVCEEATRAFAAASEEIRGLEARLLEEEGAEGAVLAKLVRRLQEHEKANLELTVTLQVLRKSHAAGSWRWQRLARGEAVAEAGVTAESGCGCAPAPPEPTEEEYSNAIAEATQALEEHVETINEALDELREAVAVLEDE